MISIVVTPGGVLTERLHRALSPRRRILCVAGQGIFPPASGAPDILLMQAPAPLACGGDVIYAIGARPEQEAGLVTAGPRAVAVISSQQAGALAYAAEHHLRTLTCGLSGHDTLTLSSLTEESAVICLQRGISTMDGRAMEPAEIPVRLCGPIERYDLLALAAVLLLCGENDRLSEPL